MTEDEMADWITDMMDMSLSKFWELVRDREAWHAAVHGLRSNNREGTQPCPSTENWINDLLSMAHPSEQDSVCPKASTSHKEASVNLLSLHIRGQKE